MVNFRWFLALLCMGLTAAACQNNTSANPVPVASGDVPFRGVTMVSPPKAAPAEAFDAVVDVNANWTAIIPFGFVNNGSAKVQYNVPWQWWGERDAGVKVLSKNAHEKGLKIMLKPQIWLMRGAFTGDFELSNEKDWQQLEATYYDYILHFADLAEELNCETYCIGTEFKRFVAARPQFWSDLIDSVRVHYSGEITYAGNWDSYRAFPHWKKLDYIGIDAYFPLSGSTTPTVKECVDGWEKHLKTIEAHQKEIGKPVLFTEYGYRSTDQCAREPWDTGGGNGTNATGQKNAYQALYQVFWNKPWFKGGFLWKWYTDHKSAGGKGDNRFTPQNKPAEDVIRRQYGA